jgi:3-mercaptopyruvate sulfurtransferase SseA
VLKGGFVDWTDAGYPIEPVTEEEYSFGEASIGGEEDEEEAN